MFEIWRLGFPVCFERHSKRSRQVSSVPHLQELFSWTGLFGFPFFFAVFLERGRMQFGSSVCQPWYALSLQGFGTNMTRRHPTNLGSSRMLPTSALSKRTYMRTCTQMNTYMCAGTHAYILYIHVYICICMHTS